MQDHVHHTALQIIPISRTAAFYFYEIESYCVVQATFEFMTLLSQPLQLLGLLAHDWLFLIFQLKTLYIYLFIWERGVNDTAVMEVRGELLGAGSSLLWDWTGDCGDWRRVPLCLDLLLSHLASPSLFLPPFLLIQQKQI